MEELIKYQDETSIDDLIDILDDDLFRNLPGIEDYHIILKEEGEYGIQIRSYKLTDDKYVKDGVSLFVDKAQSNKYHQEFYITSYEYYENDDVVGNNLKEIIFSNRTEYYLNGIFRFSTSNEEDFDSYEYIFDQINKKIMIDKVYPWLFELVESYYDVMIIESMEDKVDFKFF